jgi:hypothetical protein
MWLRDPARIEGLLTCHFIAMLLSSLIERTIRRAMAQAGLDELSLYPEDRGCAAPTTARILGPPPCSRTPWMTGCPYGTRQRETTTKAAPEVLGRVQA